MIVTDRGIVIRSVKYAEYDLLITILTEHNGKVFFRASGIRSLTSKNAAGCLPYTYSEFVLDRRGDRYYLKKASAIKSLTRYGMPIANIALCAYFAELCDDTVYDADGCEHIMRMLANALYVVSYTDRDTDVIKAIFEMRLLSELGFMPELTGCCVCHRPYEEFGKTVYFNMLDANITCPDCMQGENKDCAQVSVDCIALVERSIAVDEKKAYAVSVESELVGEFCAFCECYLLAQLEKKYKTLDFYKEVRVL